MTCKHCQQWNMEHDLFCGRCNQPLRSSVQPLPNQQPTPNLNRPQETLPMGSAPTITQNEWFQQRYGYGSGFPANASQKCMTCANDVPLHLLLCQVCNTQVGYRVNPNDSTATNMIPNGVSIPLRPVFVGDIEAVPPPKHAIPYQSGWNWAAAIYTPAWAYKHKLAHLAVFSVFVSIGFFILALLLAIYHRQAAVSGTLQGMISALFLLLWFPKVIFAGVYGNTWAMRSGVYKDKTTYRKSQRRWAIWAFLGCSLYILFILFVASISYQT